MTKEQSEENIDRQITQMIVAMDFAEATPTKISFARGHTATRNLTRRQDTRVRS